MLLLEEAIEIVVNKEGQQIVPLAAFSLDKLRIQNMFKNALKEYSEYFPNTITETVNSDSTGNCYLPKATGSPTSLRFSGFSQVPPLNSTYNKPEWYWNNETKTIQSLMVGGPWIVTYPADYTISNMSVEDRIMTLKNEEELEFNLAGEFKGESLVIKRESDNLSMSVDCVYTKDGLTLADLSGKLGNGVVDLTNLRCKLYLDSTKDDNLIISYVSKYLGVKELDKGSREFLDWFGSILLTSIGTLKLLSQIDGLPFNIAVDDLRARGIELQNKVDNDIRIRDQLFYRWTAGPY